MRIPRRWRPSGEAVDVVRCRLDLPEPRVERFARLLDADERRRAERFRPAHKRREFVVTRGLTRVVLARALDADPAAIDFVYGPHGKPELAETWQNAAVGRESLGGPLRFNVSHSGDWALLAVVVGRQVGVDVEQMRERVPCELLARHYFSASEVENLMGLPESERRRAFFRCWSRKEAFIKAIGRGVGLGLDRFDVSLRPEQLPAVSATRFDESQAERWWLAEIDVADDYAGAVAAERPQVELRHWEPPL